MNKTRNTMLGIVSALALAASAGFALYSCDGFADAAAQAAGDEADAGRFGRNHLGYTIRGPKGEVNYVFLTSEVGNLDEDYVLGTDRTVHDERGGDYLRAELEAAGITVTDYSTGKAGESWWVEFNLKEIVEFEQYWY